MLKTLKLKHTGVEQITQTYAAIMDYHLFVRLHLMIAYAEGLHVRGKSSIINCSESRNDSKRYCDNI